MPNQTHEADRLRDRIAALRIQHPDMTQQRARILASRQLAEEVGSTWLVLFDDVEHLTSEELKAYMGQFPFEWDKKPQVRFSDSEERQRAAEDAIATASAAALARQEDRHRRARIERTRRPFEDAWLQDVNRYGPGGADAYGMPVDERLRNAAAGASTSEEAERFREAIGYRPPKSSWFDDADDVDEV